MKQILHDSTWLNHNTTWTYSAGVQSLDFPVDEAYKGEWGIVGVCCQYSFKSCVEVCRLVSHTKALGLDWFQQAGAWSLWETSLVKCRKFCTEPSRSGAKKNFWLRPWRWSTFVPVFFSRCRQVHLNVARPSRAICKPYILAGVRFKRRGLK